MCQIRSKKDASLVLNLVRVRRRGKRRSVRCGNYAICCSKRALVGGGDGRRRVIARRSTRSRRRGSAGTRATQRTIERCGSRLEHDDDDDDESECGPIRWRRASRARPPHPTSNYRSSHCLPLVVKTRISGAVRRKSAIAWIPVILTRPRGRGRERERGGERPRVTRAPSRRDNARQIRHARRRRWMAHSTIVHSTTGQSSPWVRRAASAANYSPSAAVAPSLSYRAHLADSLTSRERPGWTEVGATGYRIQKQNATPHRDNAPPIDARSGAYRRIVPTDATIAYR